MKILEKMILRKMIVFFVKLILEIVPIAPKIRIILISSMFKLYLDSIQFSVLDPQFSVLVQFSANSNSLYRIPNSLKN